jgi:CubicO group peptidase (beta-lactamase class C family)
MSDCEAIMTITGKRSKASRALHETMKELVEHGNLPGLVFYVEKRGQQYRGEIGIANSSGTPMRRDTIFRIASLTKPIMGVATLMLVEDGALSLDQPIEQVLPELANIRVLRNIDSDLNDTVPLNRPITVEDILTFRTGTGLVLAPPGTYPIQAAMESTGLGFGPPDPAGVPQPDEWIQRLANLPMVYQPGSEWMYNTSADLLGVAISRATGKSLPDLLNELIFVPLGMSDTAFHVSPNDENRFTSLYARDHETATLRELEAPSNSPFNAPPLFPSGASGLVSTIEDFTVFARLLLNQGQHNGAQMLSRASVAEMTCNHLSEQQRLNGEVILSPGNGWGFCTAVRAAETDEPGQIGSYGWSGGFGTTWLNDPNEEMIAVLFTQVHFETAALPDAARTFLRLALDL